MLGRAYREIGNTQAALTAFQTIIDHYPTDPLFGDGAARTGADALPQQRQRRGD